MIIVLYINTLSGGGAERVMSELANRFAEGGDRVVLVTSFPTEGEYGLSPKVTRCSLEARRIERSRISKNLGRIRGLRRLCREYDPDIVLSFMCEPNFRALLATVGLRAKCVVSVRNDPAREYAGRSGRFVGKVLMPLLADACVLQTSRAARWFPTLLQEKSVVIPNAVAEEFFNGRPDADGSYWIAVGRLAEQKNYPMMLRAFRSVVDELPEEQLRIYGEGDWHERLQEMSEELGLAGNVTFCGATRDVAGVLAGAKGFLLTSDYEGMPNALMEALAMGVPCVSTDCPCGGPAGLIEDGVNGFLIRVGDADGMAKAVIRLSEDSEERQRIGAEARSRALDFKPERVFPRWHELLVSVCAR